MLANGAFKASTVTASPRSCASIAWQGSLGTRRNNRRKRHVIFVKPDISVLGQTQNYHAGQEHTETNTSNLTAPHVKYAQLDTTAKVKPQNKVVHLERLVTTIVYSQLSTAIIVLRADFRAE